MPIRYGILLIAHVGCQMMHRAAMYKCYDYTSKCNMDLLRVVGAHCLQWIADLT